MMVWPLSWSEETRKLGSSAARRESDAHLLLVRLGLGLHRDLDDRIRELHPLEDDRGVRRAQGVAGGVLEVDQGDDVAGERASMSSRSLACISSMRPTFSFLSLTEFITVERALELARIDAGEGQGADERVGHDLEGQSREGRSVVGRAGVLGLAVHLEPLIGGTSSGLGR